MLIANLEYYKVFYYTVKCGSVTRASEELSLSQPAVSQSLKQLERILGIRLLKRTSRGISPTAEGKLLFSSSPGWNGFTKPGQGSGSR